MNTKNTKTDAPFNRFDAGETTQENAVDKVFESLGFLDKMTNANEAMQTTLTGYGKEYVPNEVLQNELIDLTIADADILTFLPGDQGRNLEKSITVPMIGEAPFMMGNPEWDGSSNVEAVGNAKVKTGSVTINQKSLILSVPISKALLNYSIVDLESKLKAKIAQSAVKTITDAIINADDVLAATGNINSDDQLPATTFGSASYHTLWFDDGLVKTAFGDSAVLDLGAIDVTDFVTMENKMGDVFGEDCLWIMNQKVYNKIKLLSEYSDASKRGETNTLNGKAIGSIDSAKVWLTRYLRTAEADGKLSATSANNTKGRMLLLYTPAVQYGWGQDFELEVVKIAGKGILLVATLDFGFTVMNASSVGLENGDKTVVMGRNIAL